MAQSKASQYSSLATPQFRDGCEFIDSLGLKPGDKVLDMGCGTGEVTRYLAEKVGKNGEVIGVDPDVERITFAQRKIAHVPAIVSFEVGNSGSAFPHNNHAYYDLHFSNQVFHWLDLKERQAYIKRAYECLKHRGWLAIQCLTKPDDDILDRLTENFNSKRSTASAKVTYAEEREIKELLVNCKFADIEITLVPRLTHYDSLDAFMACYVASANSDVNELPDKKLLEDFKKKTIQKDGRVKCIYKTIQVKARKATTPESQTDS